MSILSKYKDVNFTLLYRNNCPTESNHIMKKIVCRKYAESLCPTQSRLDQLSTYTARENFRQEILKFHTIIHCTHTLEETSDKKFWEFKKAHIMHSYAGESSDKFYAVVPGN